MKRSRKIICFYLSVVMILGVILYAPFSVKSLSKAPESDFINSCTELFSRYDKNIENRDIDFAYSRLVVPEYNGNSYGACEVVEGSSIAFLQYNSPSDAENAYKKMKADGLKVDIDSKITLDSYAQGEMCTYASEMTGTTDFASSFNIEADEVTVALIDTGVMYDHEQISTRFVNTGYDLTEDGCTDAYYDTRLRGDYYEHATMIAGIIANNTSDNVKILPYKIVRFGASDSALSYMLAGLQDAIDKGVDVINMSISSNTGGDSFSELLSKALEKKICVCCSAGNNGSRIYSKYPAATPGAIAVSAVTSSGEITSWSNYGSVVSYAAPGSKITSCAPGENSSSTYLTGSGTSYAAPYVTACCANIKSISKDFTKEEICEYLNVLTVDAGDAGKDDYYGNGIVKIGQYSFSDSIGENALYSLDVLSGTLEISGSGAINDFETANSSKWAKFAQKLKEVTVSPNINEIGSYCFLNCRPASFSIGSNFVRVGKEAFKNSSLSEITFSINVTAVGSDAFALCNDFVINGYYNTPAKNYADQNNVTFNKLGCKHNYLCELVEPTEAQEGYSVFTCVACGDTYYDDYAVPEIVEQGACGANIQYILYNTGKLKLVGSGEMFDYDGQGAPWSNTALVNSVEIAQNITKVSTAAFAFCPNIINFSSLSSSFSVDKGSLYNSDMSEIICYANANVSDIYVMPSTLTSFSKLAFAGAKNISGITVNSNFTNENGIIYSQGKIAAAFGSFESLVIEESVSQINDYAFIGCGVKYAEIKGKETAIGKYALGFESSFEKGSLTVHSHKYALCEDYAKENGFSFTFYNACGENCYWEFDESTNTLSILGEGDMGSYTYKQMPWSEMDYTIENVVIGDGVTSVCSNAFRGETSLKTVLFSESVKNILAQAFYGCTSLSEIVLPKNLESVGTYCFIACTNLKSITFENQTAKIGTRSIGYVNVNDTVSGAVIYAYYGSSAHSYALNNSIEFSPTGCLHNNVTENKLAPTCTENGYLQVACNWCGAYIEDLVYPATGHNYTKTVYAACCTDGYTEFTCNNCSDSYITDRVAAKGITHYVKGRVIDQSGLPLEGVSVSVDGAKSAVTNGNGYFIIEGLKCGTYSAVFSKEPYTTLNTTITVNRSNTRSNGYFKMLFGDYTNDGYVNARDYAVALNGSLDYSKMILALKTLNPQIDVAYESQDIPGFTSVTNSADSSSAYRREFFAYKVNPVEYHLIECGFIYGRDMSDDDLVLENVGKTMSGGYVVKKAQGSVTSETMVLSYGVSSMQGTASARGYYIYSNGVEEKTVYSEISRYSY